MEIHFPLETGKGVRGSWEIRKGFNMNKIKVVDY